MFRRLKLISILVISSFILTSLSACTKNKETSKNKPKTTLKLVPPVKVSVDKVSKKGQILKLKPIIDTNKKLRDVEIKWLLDFEGEKPQDLFSQSFSGKTYAKNQLETIDVVVTDPSINHKIVLLVSGKVNGKNFDLSAIYNSNFQEDINEAKEELLERSKNHEG